MAIAVKLDDLLHARRMTLTELADRVGITLANLRLVRELRTAEPAGARPAAVADEVPLWHRLSVRLGAATLNPTMGSLMQISKPVGRAIGLLLLVQLVAGLTLPYILLLPVSTPAGAFLESAAEMAGTVRLSVLMLFAGGAIPLVIAILVWPCACERHVQLALWLVAIAIVSFVLQVIENAHWLSLLSISEAYAAAGSNDASAYQTVSLAAHSGFRWVHYLCPCSFRGGVAVHALSAAPLHRHHPAGLRRLPNAISDFPGSAIGRCRSRGGVVFARQRVRKGFVAEASTDV